MPNRYGNKWEVMKLDDKSGVVGGVNLAAPHSRRLVCPPDCDGRVPSRSRGVAKHARNNPTRPRSLRVPNVELRGSERVDGGLQWSVERTGGGSLTWALNALWYRP